MKKSLSRGRECVLLCTIQLLLCAVVYRFNIPNPNIILFVFLSAVLVQCGYLVGTLCGILTLLYSMFFFSIDHSWIYFEPINRDKLIVVLLGLIANICVIGHLQQRNKNAMREEVIEALHNAQCDDIIEKLPGGIDTVIGSKGTYLSGGETQRIAIARAMLKNAPILILDEATAFADPDNEAKVQAAFSKLSEGKTVIMIAHRLSSVTEVDRIYVLKNGQICQSGTHENLLSQDGLYAHMWKEFNKSVSWKVGA